MQTPVNWNISMILGIFQKKLAHCDEGGAKAALSVTEDQGLSLRSFKFRPAYCR
jgi:hypothetical protein